ncbi:MAG: PEGA domain-containing protein [Myxococcota bacterium]|nr:PEGA domain-containing protein [Myxococcota bacterium]
MPVLARTLLLVALAVALAPPQGWSKSRRRDRTAGAQAGPRAGSASTQTSPDGDSVADRPLAALRVDCADGLAAPLCAVVRDAAAAAASRAYRLLEQRPLEELFAREPALRACRLEECRVAITDHLGVPRLIDVHIHTGARGGLVGSVSIYDAVAKGISGDTDAPLGRRDEKHVRKAIGDAVEYVIGAQRLTATLQLDIQPEGATVKIDDKDRGAVREVKLFLGPHRIRVEKVGYRPVERTVNITPAGTREQIRLEPLPVRVQFEILPPGTRVLVDGDPVDARTNVVELTEGRHRVQALAPPESGYDSLDFEIDVHVGMQPIRRVLPRLAQLRIQAPLGYTVRVDNQMMAPGRRVGLQQALTVNTGPGLHIVTAESWRGRLLRASAQLVPGTAADIWLRPPSLVPGLVLAGLGLVGLAGGAAMHGLHGQCSTTECEFIYDFSWQTEAPQLQPPAAAYLTLSLGAAALVVGSVWFAVNAADHPLFNKKVRLREGARLTAASAFMGSAGALVIRGRF